MEAVKTKHGLTGHPLYTIWTSMKQRINNKNDNDYESYGGRGIIVCSKWSEYFLSFYNWSLNNGWKKGLTIDRIDNDGNYYPKNCRFITGKQNVRNQRLLHLSNTSGYRGVHKTKKLKNPFRAQITIDNKSVYLGLFLSPRLAALRYDVEAYLLNDGRPRNIF